MAGTIAFATVFAAPALLASSRCASVDPPSCSPPDALDLIPLAFVTLLSLIGLSVADPRRDVSSSRSGDLKCGWRVGFGQS